MADERDAPSEVRDLLAAGRKVIEDARQTMADLDDVMNTAVVPVVAPDQVPAGD